MREKNEKKTRAGYLPIVFLASDLHTFNCVTCSTGRHREEVRWLKKMSEKRELRHFHTQILYLRGKNTNQSRPKKSLLEARKSILNHAIESACLQGRYRYLLKSTQMHSFPCPKKTIDNFDISWRTHLSVASA